MTRLLKSGPTCAVCGHPVESTAETDDPHLRRVTFVAKCHGAVEVVQVDYDALEHVTGFWWALAFADGARRVARPCGCVPACGGFCRP